MSREAVILLVEDNPMDIEVTLDAFRQAGLTNPIHVAQTGQEALDYVFGKGTFQDRRRYPLPDLILLDLNLPGISGHEVLREVKAAHVVRRIPVVILTSSQGEGDRAMGYDEGANSYLVKPVGFEEFVRVVRGVGEYWLTLNVGPPKG